MPTDPAIAENSTVTDRPVRLLYVMHVDWDWIKQRPQAMAEELASDPRFSLCVAYLPNWRRRQLISNASGVRRQALWQMPLGRFGLIRRLNLWLARVSLQVLASRFRPDVVLITYPTLLTLLPSNTDRLPLYYDCMDLASGFAENPGEAGRLDRIESKVIERAKVVFVSSEFLAARMRERYASCRPLLVRNGFGGIDSPLSATDPKRFSDPYRVVRLGYFGTVATWFDSPLITNLLESSPLLELHLWGPVVATLPNHSRLYVHGAVSHADLADAVKNVDALIMPFVLSDLIRGVDPVKLYEYVALRKPVLSVYYPELSQFDGLVHFYRSPAELDALLDRLRSSRDSMLPDAGMVREFLAGATWHSRASAMADEISRWPSRRI